MRGVLRSRIAPLRRRRGKSLSVPDLVEPKLVREPVVHAILPCSSSARPVSCSRLLKSLQLFGAVAKGVCVGVGLVETLPRGLGPRHVPCNSRAPQVRPPSEHSHELSHGLSKCWIAKAHFAMFAFHDLDEALGQGDGEGA